jgi:hypothetical protein
LTKFLMVKNDLRPSILATLQYSDGSIVDLTGCTAKFVMTQSGTEIINKTATVLSPATSGQVRYDWASGDTAHVGMYKGEFQITFADTKVMTFPTDGSLDIEFRDVDQ